MKTLPLSTVIIETVVVSFVLLIVFRFLLNYYFEYKQYQQQESIKRIADSCEQIIKMIKLPGCYPVAEVSQILSDFDDKILLYGSCRMVSLWLEFKLENRIAQLQVERQSVTNIDIEGLSYFIVATRKALGCSVGFQKYRCTKQELEQIYGL